MQPAASAYKIIPEMLTPAGKMMTTVSWKKRRGEHSVRIQKARGLFLNPR